MTESQRQRAREILAALRELPPGVLDVAAAQATGRDAEQLRAVRAAVASEDPEGSLAAVLENVERSGATDAALPLLIEHAKNASKSAAHLKTVVADMTASRRELAFLGATIKAAVPVQDRALHALLEQALGLLGEDGPFAAVKTAFAAAGDAEKLLATFGAGQPDAAEVAAAMTTLRAAKSSLEAAQDKLARLPQLIAAARTFAKDKGNVDADARLALADAVLRDRTPGTEQRWTIAFDRLVDARLVGLARAAATRVQMYALQAREPQKIVDVAAKISELAARSGDRDALIEALGDQAVILAQHASRERALELLEEARNAAGDDALWRVKLALLDAQVHELLGDVPRAKKLFGQVMEQASELEGAAQVLGWAALHLGRIHAAAGARFQANEHLQLAEQIGNAGGDETLVALAAEARKRLSAL